MQTRSIGYAGLTQQEFIQKLKRFRINVLVDVRRWPTSKYPGFKGKELAKELPECGIAYRHLEKLGGYRRGYEKYTKTDEFKAGLDELIALAKNHSVCIMCLERDSKYCHRRYIIKELKKHGIEVKNL